MEKTHRQPGFRDSWFIQSVIGTALCVAVSSCRAVPPELQHDAPSGLHGRRLHRSRTSPESLRLHTRSASLRGVIQVSLFFSICEAEPRRATGFSAPTLALLNRHRGMHLEGTVIQTGVMRNVGPHPPVGPQQTRSNLGHFPGLFPLPLSPAATHTGPRSTGCLPPPRTPDYTDTEPLRAPNLALRPLALRQPRGAHPSVQHVRFFILIATKSSVCHFGAILLQPGTLKSVHRAALRHGL